MPLFKRSADASAAGSSAGNLPPADPAAALKQRARRRLIGAVVLALTAAVAVPLVLDTKPKPWADDVNIQIPPKTSSYTPPMQADGAKGEGKPDAKADAAKPATDAAVAEAPAKSDAPKADAAASKPEPAAPVVMAPPKAEAAAPKAEAAPAKPAEKPAPKVETKAEPKADPKAEPKTAAKPELKAGTKADTKADPKPATTGKVIVQAGAFQTEDKIKAVEAQVRKAGFVPYREAVETSKGEITRVRFAVANEDAAKKAIAKLSLEGLSPRVVN